MADFEDYRTLSEIENCLDPTEKYNVEFASSAIPIYQNNVYALIGNPTLVGKCWKVNSIFKTQSDIPPYVLPDYSNVIKMHDYGPYGCQKCLPVYKFELCSQPGTFRYITFVTPPRLTTNWVYQLSFSPLCYKFIGAVQDHGADTVNVTIITDYDTDDCSVCNPVYRFQDCDTEEVLYIQFSDPNVFFELDLQDLNTAYYYGDIGKAYKLSGASEVNDKCLIFLGLTDENEALVITDITIVKKFCGGCGYCKPLYKLTDCKDPLNTKEIYWEMLAEPLDETKIYVFDFDPNVCYSVDTIFRYCYNRS